MEPRFLVNALAFIAISLAQWSLVRPGAVWVPCFVLGTLYLASAFIRATRVSPGVGTLENLTLGGYEGAVTLSAGLVAAGVYSVGRGLWIDAAWLIEAEVLFGCSLYLGRPFLGRLAAVLFVLPMGKLVFSDIPTYSQRTWSPVALLCTVIGFTAPAQWVPVHWLLVAGGLFELGLHEPWPEMRTVAHAVPIPSAVWISFQNVQAGLLEWPVHVAGIVQGCAYFVRLVRLRRSLEQTKPIAC